MKTQQSKQKRLNHYGIEDPMTTKQQKICEGYNMKRKFKKVEDKIFKFEKYKDCIEGELLSIENGTNYNNKVYKIKDESNDVYTVFSTSVLESKMNSVKIGDVIRITYTSQKESKKKGQNPTKIFEVEVAED